MRVDAISENRCDGQRLGQAVPSPYFSCAASMITALALLGGTPARAAEPPIPKTARPTGLEAPVGGWRDSSGAEQRFLQPVSYPASSVSSDTSQPSAAIRGRIAAAPKSPATLVVNGVAMPLALEADGAFGRPWVFGPGSNSIEVRSPDGSESHRLQFYEAAEDRLAARLRVVLCWDTDATDLDLHVLSPLGEHVFYGERLGASGGALDIDVTTGYGPEIFAHPAPPPGTWLVFVNYFGAGELNDVITICDVTVVTEEGTADEKRQFFRVPLRRPGDLTEVARFVLP